MTRSSDREEFQRLPKRLYPSQGALPRPGRTGDDLTVADALYLVVAGALGATLVTTDERLAGAARARSIPVASPGRG